MGEFKTSRVASVTPIGYFPVYNMEVKDSHNFSVNGGLIVHNCRYFCMSRPSPAPDERLVFPGSMTPEEREQTKRNLEFEAKYHEMQEMADRTRKKTNADIMRVMRKGGRLR